MSGMRRREFISLLGGLEVVPLEVRRPDDIAPAFEALNGRAAALPSGTRRMD